MTTTRGTWAVKESFTTQSFDEARTTGLFQEHACAHGVPAPAIARDDHGLHLSLVDGAFIRVYDWVDLHDADATINPADVGKLIAGMHRAAFPAEGPVHRWHTEPVGATRWRELTRRAKRYSAPFADELADVVDRLVAVEDVLEPMDSVQTCHLDVWADNVRLTVDGGLCVIDWENAGPADPRRELAMVLFEFGRRDGDRLRALHAAYAEVGGRGSVQRPADFSVAVAQLNHIGERHLSMWLDPQATDEVKTRAARGIQEILDDPLDIDTISLILDAVG